MRHQILATTFGLVAMLVAWQSGSLAAWDPAKVEGRDEATRQALQDFMNSDPSLKRYFDEAYAYAVFPKVGSGAFIVGGTHGKGEVFEQGKVVGEARITAVSVGLSIGGKNGRSTPSTWNRMKGKLVSP